MHRVPDGQTDEHYGNSATIRSNELIALTKILTYANKNKRNETRA